MRRVLLAAAMLVLSSGGAHACGVETDCVVDVDGQGERTYRIYLPASDAAPSGVIVFAHGYRSSATNVMRNTSFQRVARRLDVAFIAVNADDHDDWVLPGAPSDPSYDGRRELDYMAAVLSDAEARFGVDGARRMMTGFSAGGMYSWNVLCSEGAALFAAYAPISGTFWGAGPDSCDGAVASVIHIHGTSDQVVPLAGRRIGPTRQGDVGVAAALYVAHGAFGAPQAAQWGEDLACERRSNADGAVFEMCLHDGGHSLRAEYIERAWRRFEALGVL